MTLSGISPLQESLREGIGGALPAGRQGILPLGKRTAGPYRRLSWGGRISPSGLRENKLFILAKESRKKTEEPSRPK